MNDHAGARAFSRFVADYGMVFVLLLLCAFFSAITYNEQNPSGTEGAAQLAARIEREAPGASVLVVAWNGAEELSFADALRSRLEAQGQRVVAVARGTPQEVRGVMDELEARGETVELVAATRPTANWLEGLVGAARARGGGFAAARLVTPESYAWPDFLKLSNLLNVANQIAIIAIIAIGMTLVIITAGIDLSVGSLIALSAVATAWLLRETGGGKDAGVLAMTLASAGGILTCGLVGAFSGVMVTVFSIPPFIVTLAMMMVASGLAYLISDGQSILDVPDGFVWLGREADFLGLPNAVVLMVVLYVIAHVLMTRTALGRYIYAVGGNPEASRLSGVPVKRVLLLVYTVCGALAGVGGVISASLFQAGSPKYGDSYELDVIAAVVVGGTSLLGGEGKVFGTLIGALITGVIRNGMNLTGVESYSQKVVLGLVILGAVLFDTLKSRGRWRRRRRRS